jgi:pimeloyl-ACP methyl ester carboxylesterase
VADPSSVVALKSTNVRSRWPARWSSRHGWRAAVASTSLRAVFGTLGRIAPGAAGELAQRLFFTPPRLPGAGALPLGAEELDVTVDGQHIAAWRCGSGPAVLLMHGWGGSSSQLGRLVPPLLQRGFSVVGVDAPAHGRSPGRLASLPEFARALGAVARVAGPVQAVIGHSLGAAAAALAVSEGLDARRLVLVGSAADPTRWARAFAARFRIPAAAMDHMGRSSERRLRFRWSELHLGRLLEGFGGGVLFVHDRLDRETRWTEAFDVAQHVSDAQVVLTEGLGHRRILAHPGVAALIAGFVHTGEARATASVPLAATCATPGCGRPAAAHGLCVGCSLDHHLFQRDTARWPAEDRLA